MEINWETINITNSNSQDIAIFKFNSKSTIKGIIVFASAMGVKQRYYRHYANYLASNGFIVYTFDYQDIGDSRDSSIRKSETTVFDWISDIKLVTNWVFEKHNKNDGVPFYYLNHSLGGQLFGFLDTQNKFKCLIGITSQNGYWRFYKTKIRYFIFWYFLMIPLTKLFGYFPAKRLKFGENLPPRVAKKWKKWCTSRNYFFDDPEYNEKQKYEQYQGSILTLSFEDDPWATEEAVADLYDRYVNANREHMHIFPKDINLSEIGHVGFFRPGSETLWNMTVEWLMRKRE
ncbi:MAG: alpha/beta hydrolase family protein [Candidatus Kariarchaeaceae archaeon]